MSARTTEMLAIAETGVCPGTISTPCGEPNGGLTYCQPHYEAAWAGFSTNIADAAPARKSSGGGTPDPERQARLARALKYVAQYVGTWGLPLDIRADRRFGSSHMTLSDRQIEVLLAGEIRDQERAAAKAAAPVVATVTVVEGWYVLEDRIYKVQKAVHGSGHLYAKVLTEIDGRWSWEYAPGAIKTLVAARPLTVEEAAKYGSLYGICVVCGAPLTDEDSIARGIGPICSGKLGKWAATLE